MFVDKMIIVLHATIWPTVAMLCCNFWCSLLPVGGSDVEKNDIGTSSDRDAAADVVFFDI